MTYDRCWLNSTKLNSLNINSLNWTILYRIVVFSFTELGLALVASDFFFHKQLLSPSVFFDLFSSCLHLCDTVSNKNDAHWNFAKICPMFSPWTPIWDHFVKIRMMSVPKQPSLELKSAFYSLLQHFITFYILYAIKYS